MGQGRLWAVAGQVQAGSGGVELDLGYQCAGDPNDSEPRGSGSRRERKQLQLQLSEESAGGVQNREGDVICAEQPDYYMRAMSLDGEQERRGRGRLCVWPRGGRG